MMMTVAELKAVIRKPGTILMPVQTGLGGDPTFLVIVKSDLLGILEDRYDATEASPWRVTVTGKSYTYLDIV